MQEEERLITTGFREEDEDAEQSLRPRTLAEYFGQDKLKKSLSVYMQAALARREPLDHILLYGPPGLGKTTLAASTGEDATTIEDIYEPYLLQLGFLMRTPRGRVCTQAAYDHMGLKMPGGADRRGADDAQVRMEL